MAADAPAAVWGWRPFSCAGFLDLPGRSAAHCCRVAQVSGQRAVLWSQKSPDGLTGKTKALVPGVRDMGFCLQVLVYKPANRQAWVCFALSL